MLGKGNMGMEIFRAHSVQSVNTSALQQEISQKQLTGAVKLFSTIFSQTCDFGKAELSKYTCSFHLSATLTVDM